MAFILFGDGYSVKEFFMNNIRVALTSKMYKFWGHNTIYSITKFLYFIDSKFSRNSFICHNICFFDICFCSIWYHLMFYSSHRC